ncbi:F-box only protein 36 isoform X2 [Onychomys torridus]|uniref:F-box only protein 36 isoform X2 n=1 Tax=Onychomys torridus TaxID=38674 RepID=UPI00167FAD5F|nr:F-box only protein 36 isoform X2 [Onychomys torridus]
MASWLPETLFEIVGQGPAPSKDYYQLLITRSQIIFRWWKISLRSEFRSAKPGETKETHEDFLENSHLQVQVALIFGARILDYVFNLCEGKFDYLERLSDKLLIKIICYLDLEDIARLAQTSSRFAKGFSVTALAVLDHCPTKCFILKYRKSSSSVVLYKTIDACL